ncbi:MAG: hypothetical protein WAO21_14440 [Verrucomicrobiia bacterium]
MHRAQAALIGHRVQAQNFTRLAFRNNLKRAAADLAIRREPLELHAGINYQCKRLATEGTLNVLRNFHAAI